MKPMRPFLRSSASPAEPGPARRALVPPLLLVLAALLLIALTVADSVLRSRALLYVAPPMYTWTGLVRTGVYMSIGALLVAAMVLASRALGRFDAAPAVRPLPEPAWLRLMYLATLTAALAFPIVLVVSPQVFTMLAQEDGPAEWLSVLLLLACGVCLATAWRRSRSGPMDMVGRAIVLLGAACFVLAGEEVSWLQRVFVFSTPESFKGNWQGEFNLHNFQSNLSNNAYYFGAGFTLLVALPMWRRLGLPLGPFEPLAPPFYLIPLGVLVTAYNYDMWNAVPTQIALAGSTGLLLALAWRSGPAGRRVALAWLVVSLVVQALFLLFGAQQIRRWDSTEYKELLIAAGLFVYCAGLWPLGGLRAAPLSVGLRVGRGRPLG